MQIPPISVLMCVCDGEKYLAQALESILKQTFNHFEFLIIEDGSSDRTREILNFYSSKDFRIRVIENQTKLGLTRSLNHGLKIAKGKYIARMDADDISLPDRFRMQFEFMERHPAVGVLGTANILIDQKGKMVWKNIPPVEDHEIRKRLIKGNIFCHSSLMIKREVFENIGLYNESYKVAQDYEIYFRISPHFQLSNLNQILHAWRVHERGTSVQKRWEQIFATLKIQIHSIWIGQYSYLNLIYLARSFFVLLTPVSIKRIIKKILRVVTFGIWYKNIF
ncbi:MAG: hypothetical protein A3B80_02705 [Elusimicrobia bacterium RIFCSPHIGHO2_02_FULL_39_36]|nr:MAG: hypothetical protein A2034_05510 [Elusimicrobia bacterium GWA2_38_7]OGR79562.1 MAG: hypothetical protein A3B80_02705 [Elusimicrobia bacterium RIFCSPHIGHO2_02_FULL_39_36]OGR99672.1 MAG: hypothetical protein A3G85_01495 [Elusimicrobia bacterium RIFCSPLOWO2_12_FULL_39_28]